MFLSKMKIDVREFRKAFSLECDLERELTDEEVELHNSLIEEELIELAEAESEVERLDAIIDSCYVLMGRVVHHYKTFYTSSLFVKTLVNIAKAKGYDVEGAWQEVHSSNMSKLCVNYAEAQETAKSYASNGYTKVEVFEHQGYFVVRNKEDVTLPCGKFVKAGKTLKSLYYREANLLPFIG